MPQTENDNAVNICFSQHCVLHLIYSGGPLWSAPIHDMSFVESLITRARRDEDKFGTAKRIIGMMSLVSEELPDVPLYYIPDRLTGVIHSMCPGFLPFRYGQTRPHILQV